jgi:hypothetical protein
MCKIPLFTLIFPPLLIVLLLMGAFFSADAFLAGFASISTMPSSISDVRDVSPSTSLLRVAPTTWPIFSVSGVIVISPDSSMSEKIFGSSKSEGLITVPFVVRQQTIAGESLNCPASSLVIDIIFPLSGLYLGLYIRLSP